MVDCWWLPVAQTSHAVFLSCYRLLTVDPTSGLVIGQVLPAVTNDFLFHLLAFDISITVPRELMTRVLDELLITCRFHRLMPWLVVLCLVSWLIHWSNRRRYRRLDSITYWSMTIASSSRNSSFTSHQDSPQWTTKRWCLNELISLSCAVTVIP